MYTVRKIFRRDRQWRQAPKNRGNEGFSNEKEEGNLSKRLGMWGACKAVKKDEKS